MGLRHLTAVTAVSVLLAAAATPVADAAPDSGDLRSVIAAKARAAGVDPGDLFAGTITLGQPQPDGSFKTVELTLGQALDELDGSGEAGTRGSGPPAAPEFVIGNTFHAWIASGSGSQLLRIRKSAVAPSTEPVLLPEPASLVFHVGGPITHIEGSYDFGIHTAGTMIGSNVDTAPGPNGSPVWLPIVSGGMVTDTRIDFLGHALFAEDQLCVSEFCVAVGGMLGNGVMMFNSRLPLGLPSIP